MDFANSVLILKNLSDGSRRGSLDEAREVWGSGERALKELDAVLSRLENVLVAMEDVTAYLTEAAMRKEKPSAVVATLTWCQVEMQARELVALFREDYLMKRAIREEMLYEDVVENRDLIINRVSCWMTQPLVEEHKVAFSLEGIQAELDCAATIQEKETEQIRKRTPRKTNPQRKQHSDAVSFLLS